MCGPAHDVSGFMQETWGLLEGDIGLHQTVVAVAIAKLSEPAAVAQLKGHGSFAGTGKALSVAAGRLSYTHGLKVSPFTPSIHTLLDFHAAFRSRDHNPCTALHATDEV